MENTKAIELLNYIQTFDGMDYGATKIALDKGIKALETMSKIAEIVKIEQQATSCEDTKLKSFEMIEKIIADYQLNQ